MGINAPLLCSLLQPAVHCSLLITRDERNTTEVDLAARGIKRNHVFLRLSVQAEMHALSKCLHGIRSDVKAATFTVLYRGFGRLLQIRAPLTGECRRCE
ncbi:hypothetical protein [Pyxidicoccus caerfyrddinensis]|uniref:hypothetical protein n=1 Tax=Pyxidicoccus caerfyrddinensis TaxID=2709663 RepID=UPI0013DBAD95|nr:hypothetical protein [Pyxidicoccus caerfyrddinensis]